MKRPLMQATAVGMLGLMFAMSAPAQVGEDEAADTATHKEIASIGTTPETRFQKLSALAMDREERLLAGDYNRQVVKVLSPDGKPVEEWKVPFGPTVIHVGDDGTVFLGGMGRIAKLDASGKVLKSLQSAEGGFPDSRVSGVAAMGDEVFVAFGSPGTLRSLSLIVRMTRDFGEPKTIKEGLRGCCQRLDMTSKDGVLYVAENARHRVLKLDREGKELGAWGSRGRKGVETFGSCCNPMNLCFGPDGTLYAAETGLGRIKKYTPDGKFLSLVGYAGVERFNQAGGLAASCSNIAFAVSKDESRVYLIDIKANLIRVLEKK